MNAANRTDHPHRWPLRNAIGRIIHGKGTAEILQISASRRMTVAVVCDAAVISIDAYTAMKTFVHGDVNVTPLHHRLR